MSSTVLWAAQLDFFCSHVLLIPDARDLKRRDPVALLHLLAERMHIRCPFNNIWDATNSMFLGDKRFKVAPYQLYTSPLITRLLLGQGGTCTMLSTILVALMKHLGYDAYMGMGITRNKVGMEMLHCIALVRTVTGSDDVWLIDPGTRLAPLFQAVPLHKVKFQGSVELGRSSFVMNKFVYSHDTNTYFRYYKHLGEGDEYSMFYETDEEEYCMKTSDDPGVLDFTQVGTKKRLVEYLKCRQRSKIDVGAFWEQNFILTGFKNGKAVVFVNNKLRLEDENGVLQESILESKEQLKTVLFTNFPLLKCPEAMLFIDSLWNSKYGAHL